jgi:hypothetical protein
MLRWVLRHVARLSGWLKVSGVEKEREMIPRVLSVALLPESLMLGSM